MKRKYIFAIVLILALSSAFSTRAEPIYGELPTEDGPSLQVQKWASKTTIKLGESITIYVNISNWSVHWAYNLSIEEPSFSQFSVIKVEDFNLYDYDAFGPKASISYSYTIKPVLEGNYTIEPTRIEYQNENGTIFRARSSYIPIYVYTETPPEDLSNLWKNILWMSLGFVAIPVIFIIIYKIRWRN